MSARVLLVEDDVLAGRFAHGVLRRVGLDADWLTDARSAIEAAASGDYAVILLDLGLPEVPGLAVARAIRKREAAAGKLRATIVALTASDPDPAELAAYGIDAFLPKPLGVDEARRLLSSAAPRREDVKVAPALPFP